MAETSLPNKKFDTSKEPEPKKPQAPKKPAATMPGKKPVVNEDL